MRPTGDLAIYINALQYSTVGTTLTHAHMAIHIMTWPHILVSKFESFEGVIVARFYCGIIKFL